MASNDDEWTPERLFKIYLHDYLKKRGMDKTAEIYRTEANIGNDSVAIECGEGFLHEWWSIFYPMYISQETGPEAYSEALKNTDIERKNVPPRIPQLSVNDLRSEYDIRKMMEQAGVLPQYLRFLAAANDPALQLFNAKKQEFLDETGSNRPQENIGNHAQNPFFRYNEIGIRLGSNVPMDPSDIVQRDIWPSDGLRETRANECFNLTPLNRYHLNVGDGAPTSLLQAPKYQQQFQGLKSQDLQALSAQLLAYSPKSQTSACSVNSSTQDLRTPLIEAELSKKDWQGFKSQDPQAQSAEELVCTPKSQTSKCSINSPTQDLRTPLTEAEISKKDWKVSGKKDQKVSRKKDRQGFKSQDQQAQSAHVLACSPKSQTSKRSVNSPTQDQRTPLIEVELSKKHQQGFKSQDSQAQSAEELACTPKSQTSKRSVNSSTHDLRTPMIEAKFSKKDWQGLKSQDLDAQSVQVLACSPKRQTSVRFVNSPTQDLKTLMIEVELSKKDRQDSMEHADQSTGHSRNVNCTFATSDICEGFSLELVGCLNSSKSEVLSCHFSSDGKVLASAGHEKKVFLWNMETFDFVTSSEAHSLPITDVRFRPGSTIFATSSFDKTVKIWDAAQPNKPPHGFLEHAERVMSLDFHPRLEDLLCSCDGNEIRWWNVNLHICRHVTKGGSNHVRFQPQFAKFLATTSGNIVNVIDIETDRVVYELKGHVEDVLSICWDVSGNHIASVSEDSARVWSVMSDGECIHILHSNGNKFQSCIFHPVYYNLLIIGCYQSFEFWLPTENCKTWTLPAHEDQITGLEASPENQMVASASRDLCVRLWK